MVNFKIHDLTTWLSNNCNTHIANISRSKGNQAIKFDQLLEYNRMNIHRMKDRSLLLNIAIDSEFLIATSNWNQSLNAERKKEFL